MRRTRVEIRRAVAFLFPRISLRHFVNLSVNHRSAEITFSRLPRQAVTWVTIILWYSQQNETPLFHRFERTATLRRMLDAPQPHPTRLKRSREGLIVAITDFSDICTPHGTSVTFYMNRVGGSTTGSVFIQAVNCTWQHQMWYKQT